DKDSVINTIEGIGVMGGTVIKPAVDSAATELADMDIGVKHILLLTDGQGETDNFDDVIEKINDNGITLSSIAVGEDSGADLLERLADECGGRYYYADSSSSVPKIFAEEVYLSGDTYYKNGDYSLIINGSNKIIDGLYQNGISNINGYIATTTKNGAREIISTDQDDPLLSCWQYGLGHTIAWMTNASGSWNPDLSGMEDYPEMWKRMLDYVCMEGSLGQDEVSVYKRRDKLEVSYYASEYSEDTNIVGLYTSPSGESFELPLMSGDPGNYSASFTPKEFGVYTVNVRRYEGDQLVASSTAIETLQFSDEYRLDISNAGFINFIESNGRMLQMDSDVFTRIKTKNRSRRDTTVYFIIAAMVLLIMVILFRRFELGKRLAGGFAVRREKSKRKSGKAGVIGAGVVAGGPSGIEGTDGIIADNPGMNQAGQMAGGTNSQFAQGPGGVGGQMPGQASGQMQSQMPGQASGHMPGAGFNDANDNDPSYQIQDGKKKKEKIKKEKIKKSKKEEAPVSSGLDTSALLKKKKDRNL
ncbi:MAG: VWA domain-containing protein, partial [Eubacterium sp.]|nr:VWA domain-containing protein [Eubacterium sp.]